MQPLPEETAQQFSDSWIKTEAHFTDLIDNHPELDKLIPVYLFVQNLRSNGHEQIFRADFKGHELILSRSAKPALHPQQNFINIKALGDSYEVTLRDSKQMLKQYRVEELDNPEVVNLFEILKALPVE